MVDTPARSSRREHRDEAPRDVPYLRPFGRPSTVNVVSVVAIGVALVLAVVLPAAIVPPAAVSAPGSKIATALGITVAFAVVAVAVALWRMLRTRDWAWVVLAGVPSVVVIAGGAVLAATKAGAVGQ